MSAVSGATEDSVLAATVVLVRDTEDGVEALMVRRSSKLEFAGGMWVFPGGRVDPEDYPKDAAEDHLGAARQAAVREAAEEAGLCLDAEGLLTFSHWTPPPQAPKRFSTWFFIGRDPQSSVRVDGGEIRDHGWMRPATALERRDAGEIELAPPTWITLHRLSAYATVEEALADTAERGPEFFATRIGFVGDAVVALYDGDAGYADADAGAVGSRHRLWMLDSGWRYERDG